MPRPARSHDSEPLLAAIADQPVTFAEIAQIMGIEPRRARSVYEAGMRKLRRAILASAIPLDDPAVRRAFARALYDALAERAAARRLCCAATRATHENP